jgi:hypothetical protein
MANIKVKYAELVREAKKQINASLKASKNSKDPYVLQERRIILEFRKRAREDFATIPKAKKKI